MKEVNAYKCEFCEKLYGAPKSCKNHEYHCYFNPKTRSCASCAFHSYERRLYKKGYEISYSTCLVNIPIGTTGLKTKCRKYLNENYKEDPEIMDPVMETYEWEKQLFSVVKRLSS